MGRTRSLYSPRVSLACRDISTRRLQFLLEFFMRILVVGLIDTISYSPSSFWRTMGPARKIAPPFRSTGNYWSRYSSRRMSPLRYGAAVPCASLPLWHCARYLPVHQAKETSPRQVEEGPTKRRKLF